LLPGLNLSSLLRAKSRLAEEPSWKVIFAVAILLKDLFTVSCDKRISLLKAVPSMNIFCVTTPVFFGIEGGMLSSTPIVDFIKKFGQSVI
jgi:hypothetical protein